MIPHERSLVNDFDGRPFALIGVNSDRDKDDYRRQAEEMGVNWRSAWQGSTSGPIPTRWGVRGWPTLYLIDHEGVIRETSSAVLRSPERLEAAIEELVQAAEADQE